MENKARGLDKTISNLKLVFYVKQWLLVSNCDLSTFAKVQLLTLFMLNSSTSYFEHMMLLLPTSSKCIYELVPVPPERTHTSPPQVNVMPGSQAGKQEQSACDQIISHHTALHQLQTSPRGSEAQRTCNFQTNADWSLVIPTHLLLLCVYCCYGMVCAYEVLSTWNTRRNSNIIQRPYNVFAPSRLLTKN